MVELAATVQTDAHVQPACLPLDGAPISADQRTCVVSGWGSVDNGTFAQRLQAAVVPIVDAHVCRRADVYGANLSASAFCAGYVAGGTDSCQGDSGGPLVCDIDGRYHVLGVVSYGFGCGLRSKPGVYTNVAEYADWINGVMRGVQ